MRKSTVRCGIIGGVLLLLGGCATPGPGDYASASAYHRQAAQQYEYNAARDRNTAQWRAWRGDQYGAAQAERAAQAEEGAAHGQRLQADKDSWLSQW